MITRYKISEEKENDLFALYLNGDWDIVYSFDEFVYRYLEIEKKEREVYVIEN